MSHFGLMFSHFNEEHEIGFSLSIQLGTIQRQFIWFSTNIHSLVLTERSTNEVCLFVILKQDFPRT